MSSPPNTNNGATDIVHVNSSPPMRIGLRVARVLKRTDGCYMRPRSPMSPTSSGRNVIPISGGRVTRLKCDFVRTEGMIIQGVGLKHRPASYQSLCLVSDLEAEHFQPLDPLSVKRSLPSTSKPIFSK